MVEQIKNILIAHKGSNNAITSSKIANIIGIDEDDTHAQTRALIFECARKYKLPVAATNRGYYLITNLAEYNKYMNTLSHRIAGIEERKRIISENFKEEKE